MNQEPLRQLGAFACKIIAVTKKEPSVSRAGKAIPAKIVVTFEDSEKRLIDGSFKIPFTEYKWDDRLMKDLMRVCGVEKISELKGKDVAIFVEPREWQGKTYWDPKGYYQLHHLKGPVEDLDLALSEQAVLNKKDPMDEIPF